MRKISDCFVGQQQADIDNIKHFFNSHPLAVIGFNAVASLIIQYLEIVLNVRLYVKYERHDYYWYLRVDKHCPDDINFIKGTIQEYIKTNHWDEFIKINRTIDESILVLKTEID
jgi:hypothetical protein